MDGVHSKFPTMSRVVEDAADPAAAVNTVSRGARRNVFTDFPFIFGFRSFGGDGSKPSAHMTTRAGGHVSKCRRFEFNQCIFQTEVKDAPLSLESYVTKCSTMANRSLFFFGVS